MNPCKICQRDPDTCEYHPCNGCDWEEDCETCDVMNEGFDCNCLKEAGMSLDHIFKEIAAERKRQNEK